MDEAFRPLSTILEDLLRFDGEYVDDAAGVRTRVTGCEIESALELSIGRGADGRLAIGLSPPLYCLRTSVGPTYHRLRLRARSVRTDEDSHD